MRKAVLIFMLVLVFTLSFSTAANAAMAPVGSCPKGGGWMLMEVMQHDQMEHKHAGLKVDHNGDGWLCMRMATPNIHVHMDNVLPLR